jgi:uncharacterized damage-inducible protein DinB
MGGTMNAAQFFDQWTNVWRDLLRAVSVLSDEDLDFRPADSYPRTVGAILQHIINLELGWIHYVIRREVDDWPREEMNYPRSVEGLRAELQRVHDETMDYLSTVDVDDFSRIIQVPGNGSPKLGWILWHVFEQEIHHRGEIFLCLSLLGEQRPKTNRPG